MIEDLFFLEKQTYKKSPVHSLDARVKIIIAFAAIIAIVAVPYSTVIYTVGAVFFAFFALMWAASASPHSCISNGSLSLCRLASSSLSSRSLSRILTMMNLPRLPPFLSESRYMPNRSSLRPYSS